MDWAHVGMPTHLETRWDDRVHPGPSARSACRVDPTLCKWIRHAPLIIEVNASGGPPDVVTTRSWLARAGLARRGSIT